ncbi:hypothetical protein E1B28_011522 [Marasmius oreades]|uniref:Uncharacterized protein n=1 Tax=Marasmius oreades TaxID=181124 RepID=A0A9P7RUV4_9AGAR|nr:uncharacterized protein E1B28_011522 [Marasmius oreades]KAG7089888.1 hypothetical protein E1B28_011522 [Marasmius oreades]
MKSACIKEGSSTRTSSTQFSIPIDPFDMSNWYEDYTMPVRTNTGPASSSSVNKRYRVQYNGVTLVGVCTSQVESRTGPRLILEFTDGITQHFATEYCVATTESCTNSEGAK